MFSVASTQPSLMDALARLERAGEHVSALNAAINAAGASDAVREAYFRWASPVGTGLFTNAVELPPVVQLSSRVGILVGEALYNLRAALDYVVYQLAALDSGERHEGTQFPIESRHDEWVRLLDPPDKWRSKKRRWLQGLSRAHRIAVGAFQPCRGCAWTSDLRDLSNPDKHREVHTVFGSGHLIDVTTTPADMDRWAESTVRVPLEVVFHDGTFVLPKLRRLQWEAAEAVNSFLDCFQNRCVHLSQ